jgi:uncharacterized membrane protein
MRYDLSDVLSGKPELSTLERALSVFGGLFLASTSMKQRPNRLLSLLALGAGSYLAYRGATGYCPVKAALNDETGNGKALGQPRTRLFSRDV